MFLSDIVAFSSGFNTFFESINSGHAGIATFLNQSDVFIVSGL